jgi:hypothetical protein
MANHLRGVGRNDYTEESNQKLLSKVRRIRRWVIFQPVFEKYFKQAMKVQVYLNMHR